MCLGKNITGVHLETKQRNVLGYCRNLGSLRYGTSTCVFIKTHMGKSLFSPELKSISITQWNCMTIGSCSGKKRTNGSAAELHEPMATIPARSRQNGRGIWLYKRSFRHRILRLLRLKRRLSRAATWHGKVRSTRSVSQGTEVTTVTEYVPCRYSTRTASW